MTKESTPTDMKKIEQAFLAGRSRTSWAQFQKDLGNTSVRRFIDAAKTFRSGDQMQELIRQEFFTKAELRDGLKRYIHLNYIECI